MKISKNNVKTTVNASNNVPEGRSKAVEHIQSAIHSLGTTCAKDDIVAKEAIANLSVVLFDLK